MIFYLKLYTIVNKSESRIFSYLPKILVHESSVHHPHNNEYYLPNYK